MVMRSHRISWSGALMLHKHQISLQSSVLSSCCFAGVAVRRHPRDRDPYPHSLAGTHVSRLPRQDGVQGFSGPPRSRGRLWDAESAVAQPSERGSDPRDGGAIAAAHAEPASAQWTQKWWGNAAAAAAPANKNIQRLKRAIITALKKGCKIYYLCLLTLQ